MFAWIVEGNEPVNVIEDDPADNKYFASAIECDADFIISGESPFTGLKNSSRHLDFNVA